MNELSFNVLDEFKEKIALISEILYLESKIMIFLEDYEDSKKENTLFEIFYEDIIKNYDSNFNQYLIDEFSKIGDFIDKISSFMDLPERLEREVLLNLQKSPNFHEYYFYHLESSFDDEGLSRMYNTQKNNELFSKKIEEKIFNTSFEVLQHYLKAKRTSIVIQSFFVNFRKRLDKFFKQFTIEKNPIFINESSKSDFSLKKQLLILHFLGFDFQKLQSTEPLNQKKLSILLSYITGKSDENIKKCIANSNLDNEGNRNNPFQLINLEEVEKIFTDLELNEYSERIQELIKKRKKG